MIPAILMMMILYSCTPDNPNRPAMNVEGYAPVYAKVEDVSEIKIEAAQSTQFPGKIYAFGSYIFQNELNKGVHIINNSDRRQPRKIAFINVPLSTEIAVKGNFLYTNNADDLVVFDISDVSKPRIVKRVKDVFETINQEYPPFQNTRFECPDASKGIVIRWERKMLEEARCRR
jgi:hypothetical protein